MNFDISFLHTPVSWFIVEVISICLLFYCIADAIRNNEGNHRVIRIGELFGFILYAGLYENIGVASHTYRYSLDRWLMFGHVPISVLIIEAIIFYAAFRLATSLKYPTWSIPIVVGFFGMISDMTIDPLAVFDLHNINGVMEGRWNWTTYYDKLFFGIPFFNFTGWFTMMFYYSIGILVGRKVFEKKQEKISVGVSYILLGVLGSFLLIISPINQFLLYLSPIFPMNTRGAEIAMLLLVSIISLIVIFYFKDRDKIHGEDYRIIWLIPLVLHVYDILAAFILRIEIAYIPSLLFTCIHMGIMWWILGRRKLSDFKSNKKS